MEVGSEVRSPQDSRNMEGWNRVDRDKGATAAPLTSNERAARARTPTRHGRAAFSSPWSWPAARPPSRAARLWDCYGRGREPAELHRGSFTRRVRSRRQRRESAGREGGGRRRSDCPALLTSLLCLLRVNKRRASAEGGAAVGFAKSKNDFYEACFAHGTRPLQCDC